MESTTTSKYQIKLKELDQALVEPSANLSSLYDDFKVIHQKLDQHTAALSQVQEKQQTHFMSYEKLSTQMTQDLNQSIEQLERSGAQQDALFFAFPLIMLGLMSCILIIGGFWHVKKVAQVQQKSMQQALERQLSPHIESFVKKTVASVLEQQISDEKVKHWMQAMQQNTSQSSSIPPVKKTDATVSEPT